MTIQKIIEIRGTGIVVRGNDMDTDRIIPARFLKEITFENMGKYAFYDERFDEKGNRKQHPFNDEKYKESSILIVNENFGCGSSREHAPQALFRHGINAIIGESFGDIFAGNCNMIGLTIVTLPKDEVEKLMNLAEQNPKEQIEINLNKKEISYNDSIIKLNISESMRKSFIEGTWDSTSMMLNQKDKIDKVANSLPYIRGF